MTHNYVASAVIDAKPAPIAHVVHDADMSEFESGDIVLEQWQGDRWGRPSVRDNITNHGPRYKRFLFCADSHGPQSSYYLSYSWNAQHAGVIHVPTDYTDPREAAKVWLEEYTKWANGEVWGIITRDAWTGEELESCWGFIGLDHAIDAAKHEFGPVSEVVEPW